MNTRHSKPRGLALAVALSLPLLCGAQYGATTQQGDQRQATGTAAAAAGSLARDQRASKLMGRDVKNPAGEKLGEVKDLIVDTGNGRVEYAVLSFGGFLGLGDKLFAYPANAFRAAADSDELVLNVDKERLRKAPGFDKDKWPDWSAGGYRGKVDNFFGIKREKVAGSSRLMRASQYLGKSVDDRQGADAGEVEDLVVNLAQQRVHYVVLDFDKKWSPDDKLLALPMNALSVPAEGDKDLVLNVPREQLDMRRGFDDNAWPDLNDPAYRRDVDSWLGRYGTR